MSDLVNQLKQFAARKRPDEKYEYYDSSCCAAKQFNDAVGREYDATFAIGEKAVGTFDGKLESIAHERPHNFGAFMERVMRDFPDAVKSEALEEV